MKNACSSNLTAGNLSLNFSEKVKQLIAKDEAITFYERNKRQPSLMAKVFLHLYDIKLC